MSQLKTKNVTPASEATSTKSSPAGVNGQKKREIYMQLLEAVESQPISKILDFVKTNNIPLDNNPIAYKILVKAFTLERKDLIRHLLKNHCHAVSRIKYHTFCTTPLHLIIKLRDVKLLEEVLEKRPVLDHTDSNGNSPLHLAFLHRFEEAVDLLLSNIEKTSYYKNTKNEYGLSHLHIACTRRNTIVLNSLLNAKIDLQDSVSDSSPYWAGYTNLHFAIEFGSLEAFKILQRLNDGEPKTVPTSSAKVAWQLIHDRLDDLHVMSYSLKDENPDDNGESETYFLLACLRKDPGLLKKFINMGAQVNQGIFDSPFKSAGDAALHFAVKRDHRETVEMLVQEGATPEDKNYNSMTSLHIALYNEKDTVLDLLYKGLDEMENNVEDKNGLGYFQIAVTRNDLQAVKTFLGKGVDPNKLIKPNSYGFSHFTALHFAVLYQHEDMAKLLIESGANVDLTGEENVYGTPLHMAIQNGYKNIIEILLKSGANVKLVRASDGNTVLHLLASNFILECTDQQHNTLASDKQATLMYIEQAAQLVDVNAQNKYGKTALHNLEIHQKKCVECLQLLLDLGADVNVIDANGFLPFDYKLYETARCNSAEYLAFYYHVQKLTNIGLDVHANNHEVCSKILKDLTTLKPTMKDLRSNELICRQQQRDEELARLKSVKIASYTSVFNFLKLEQTRAAGYVPNEVLEQMLMRKNFDDEYPSYGYLIRMKYKSCFRAKVIDKNLACSGTDEDDDLPSKRQRLE